MLKNKLTGLGVALITPFKEDETVDFDALDKLLDYQLESNTDYLVLMGTTSEAPTLSEAEKAEITGFTTEKMQGRLPIVLGFGGNNTRAMLDNMQKTDFSGVDALLIATPYYNKPSQEGLYQHYKALANASPLPIVLYNVPGRTGVNLTAQTTLRLAKDFPNIIATKEASGNVAQITEIIENRPATFEVISGDDAMAFPLAKLGAIGVISVLGNAFPRQIGDMIRLALSGETAKAEEIHLRFKKLTELIFADGSPAGVKCILDCMGLANNKLRLPLVPVCRNVCVDICETLKNF